MLENDAKKKICPFSMSRMQSTAENENYVDGTLYCKGSKCMGWDVEHRPKDNPEWDAKEAKHRHLGYYADDDKGKWIPKTIVVPTDPSSGNCGMKPSIKINN